eukprot:8117963-Lingulodinium_polyedra.AAC.1
MVGPLGRAVDCAVPDQDGAHQHCQGLRRSLAKSGPPQLDREAWPDVQLARATRGVTLACHLRRPGQGGQARARAPRR